jgi:hypothetical protein
MMTEGFGGQGFKQEGKYTVVPSGTLMYELRFATEEDHRRIRHVTFEEETRVVTVPNDFPDAWPYRMYGDLWKVESGRYEGLYVNLTATLSRTRK